MKARYEDGVLIVEGGLTEAELSALAQQYPDAELVDLRDAEMEPQELGALEGFARLRGVGIPGWDNFDGNKGDNALRLLAKLPNLDRIHAKYCMSSIGTPEIFGSFPKLKRVWADYWCTDEEDMLDDLKQSYPHITFVGYGGNFGDMEDDEPHLRKT